MYVHENVFLGQTFAENGSIHFRKEYEVNPKFMYQHLHLRKTTIFSGNKILATLI